MWVRDIYKQREVSVYHTLVQYLQLGDRGFYFK